jgi:RHS repeat-associated protein
VRNNAGPNGEDIQSETVGNLFLAKNPEAFTHDTEGNLTFDGRWEYTWDGENRLIRQETIVTVPAAAKRKLEFAYDAENRRIRKQVFNWNGSAWVLQKDLRFLYDGWNLISELDAANTILRNFVWGLDLSRTPQGAGGVGGLLAIREGTESHLPAFDGNGNVMALVKASDQSISARYEYGPFGETLVVEENGVSNPFRFSTKYLDGETGLYYYGWRYYNPVTGRWPSRDPIEERGGINLYGMVANDPVNRWDVLGLKEGSGTECCDEKTISEGKKKLTEVYEKTHKQWEADGVPHRGEDDNSCFNLNSQILIEFTPIPKCWECKLENGRTDPQGGWGPFFRKVYDHWVVVCKATAQDGSEAGEISFDYWANRPAGEDPNDWFRKRYKNPGEPDWDPPQFHRVCGSKKLVIK